jgi:ArsR family transcriptional regulator
LVVSVDEREATSLESDRQFMEDWRDLKMMTKALSGVARLTIVYHLARQPEISVTDLTAMLNISQPLVSWHLRKLRRAGLIQTRRTGRQVYCSLNHSRFQQCLERLGRLVDPSQILEVLPVGSALIEADAGMND